MAKKWKSHTEHEAVYKGTSIGRNPITSTMNKKKKASFKKYRGQGLSLIHISEPTRQEAI